MNFLNSFSWIRDSSFTLYALIRLGFTQEANGGEHSNQPRQTFTNASPQHSWSSSSRVCNTATRMGPCRSCTLYTVCLFLSSANVAYTVRLGEKDLEEIELTHLDGHKGSKPVRYVYLYMISADKMLRFLALSIGNGAADHLQLVSLSSSLHLVVLSNTPRISTESCTQIIRLNLKRHIN